MKKRINIVKLLNQIIPDKNNFIYGFANLDGLLKNKYREYKYGIIIGKKLDDRIMDNITDGPNTEYFELYENVNANLSGLITELSTKLNELNIDNMTIKPTASDEELTKNVIQNLDYGFSHKMVATRAGLGWIGKTDLFISKKFGPRVRLASLLTNIKVPYSKKNFDECKCGACNLCVDSCPAKAANGRLWNINTNREYFYDAFKCREKCRELSIKKINKDISICGICVSVCPIGKKAK